MKSYLEMVEDALIILSERKGSSRSSLWKCVNAKYPEADYKQFLIRLKKLSRDGTEIIYDKGRYRLTPSYKIKILKALKKGTTPKRVKKTKATMKKTKKK